MARGATAGSELVEWAPEQRAANVTKSEGARSLTIAILHNIITGYTQARSALLKPLKDYRDSLEELARPHQRRARYDDPAYIRRSGSCADDPAITPLVMASVGDAAPFIPTAWRSLRGKRTFSCWSRNDVVRIVHCTTEDYALRAFEGYPN